MANHRNGGCDPTELELTVQPANTARPVEATPAVIITPSRLCATCKGAVGGYPLTVNMIVWLPPGPSDTKQLSRAESRSASGPGKDAAVIGTTCCQRRHPSRLNQVRPKAKARWSKTVGDRNPYALQLPSRRSVRIGMPRGWRGSLTVPTISFTKDQL